MSLNTNDQTETISINSINEVLDSAKNSNEQSNENSPFDIFSNPQIQKAKESLPPHVRKQYEQIGENIWNQMESSKQYNAQYNTQNNAQNDHEFGVSNLPPPVEEAAANISEAIKSGLHPTMLDPEEEKVMVHCFGESWFEKFGYDAEDMKETF